MKKVYFVLIIFLVMINCVLVQASEVLHKYEISVVDIDKKPLKDIEIIYSLKDISKDKVIEDTILKIPSKSFFIKTIKVPSVTTYRSYKTKLSFEIRKDGYYPESGAMIINSYEKDVTKKNEIVLIKPLDFFQDKSNLISSDVNLKEQLFKIIDLIVLKKAMTNADLFHKSIDFITFKNKKYLQFKFVSLTTFNSLKINKYDLAKNLFDDVIREAMTFINKYVSKDNSFFGYDFIIIGFTKNFSSEYSVNMPMIYRFMIPETIARKYKDKDISGQKVLDYSIILMGEDRIELKLQ